MLLAERLDRPRSNQAGGSDDEDLAHAALLYDLALSVAELRHVCKSAPGLHRWASGGEI